MCLLCYLYPFFLRVCTFVGNAESVAGLKGRVKATQDKTKELLKALNGSRETLNGIPNGRSAQKKHKPGRRVTPECVRVYVCVGEKERWRRAGSIPGQAQLDACQLLHALGGALRWEEGLPRPRPLPKLRLNERSRKQQKKEIRCHSCKWVTPRTLTTARSILIKMPVSGFPNNTVKQLFNYWIHNVPHRNTIIYRQRSINLCSYSSILFSFFSQIYVFGWLLFSLIYIYAFHQAHHTWRWHIHSYF